MRYAMVSTHGYFDVNKEGRVDTAGRPDTGGQTVYVVELSKGLSSLGHEVDIFTRCFTTNRVLVEKIPGFPNVRMIRIPGGPQKFVPKEHIYPHLDGIIRRGLSFIKKEGKGYDVIHGHYVDGGIVAAGLAEGLRVPWAFTSHSLGALKRERLLNGSNNEEDLDREFNFPTRIDFETEILLSACGVTVTSRRESRDIQRLYGIMPKGPVDFIPPGVDTHNFCPSRNNDLNPSYVLTLGRVAKTKGLPLLLKAFREVLKKIQIPLVIAGGSPNPVGEEKEVLDEIKAFIAEQGIGDYVELIGAKSHNEAPDVYRGARVFVMASTHEPFGMVPLEAMACGVPTIVSEFSGVAERLTNGGDCLIVNPKNTAELANAIEMLFCDAELSRKLSVEGCKTVNGEFSWQAIARQHLDFYRRF